MAITLMEALLVLGIVLIVLVGLIVMEWVRRGPPRRAERVRETVEEPAEPIRTKEAFMSGMERNFLRAAIAGLIATYVFTMAGFWQVGIGLPKVDVGQMLADNMGRSYIWGQAAHFINGVLLALIYAWLYRWLPGPGVVKGLLYGILAMIAAGLAIVPLVTASMPAPAGIFFTQTPDPGMMSLGALVAHLLYGITLGIAYRPVEEAG
jgi:uncharacterized membrane protein YagU involved in acid resistance